MVAVFNLSSKLASGVLSAAPASPRKALRQSALSLGVLYRCSLPSSISSKQSDSWVSEVRSGSPHPYYLSSYQNRVRRRNLARAWPGNWRNRCSGWLSSSLPPRSPPCNRLIISPWWTSNTRAGTRARHSGPFHDASGLRQPSSTSSRSCPILRLRFLLWNQTRGNSSSLTLDLQSLRFQGGFPSLLLRTIIPIAPSSLSSELSPASV